MDKAVCKDALVGFVHGNRMINAVTIAVDGTPDVLGQPVDRSMTSVPYESQGGSIWWEFANDG